jgi:competence protein ComEC
MTDDLRAGARFRVRLNVLGFAIGVWLLQMQAVLPSPGWWWWTPVLALAGLSVFDARSAAPRALRRSVMLICCLACGFLWAAWLAGQRLADALPVQWEGADIEVVGVVATLPQPYERSLRFEFDVERVLTRGWR